MAAKGTLKNSEKLGLGILFIFISICTWVGYEFFGTPGALIPVIAGILLIGAVTLSAQRRLRNEIYDLYRNLEALSSLIPILNPTKPLPPFGGHALSANRARTLVEALMAKRPTNVVELGSGVSTVLTALCLKHQGFGTIDSYEHEQMYAELTRELLKVYDLTDIATVHHAPLRPLILDNTKYNWYNIDNLQLKSNIDFLIVDGPPRKTQTHARYPAMPVLSPMLENGAVVILDDADRDDERWITNKWKSSHNLTKSLLQHDINMLVLEYYK